LYLAKKGDYDAAILELQEAIRRYPEYVPTWVNLAKIYTLQHNWALAREAYQHAATIDPVQSALFTQLASLADSNVKAEAINELQSAADRVPSDFAAWIRLGDAAGQAGQWQRSADAFQHAAALQPANLLVLDKWGIALQRAGKSAQAVGVLERALQRQPDALLIRQSLAAALAGDNRLPEANAQLRRILELNPTWEHADQVHFALAVNLERSGSPSSAAEEYQRALAINPALDPARQRLAALTMNPSRSSPAPTP